jgi:hypothetical protein
LHIVHLGSDFPHLISDFCFALSHFFHRYVNALDSSLHLYALFLQISLHCLCFGFDILEKPLRCVKLGREGLFVGFVCGQRWGFEMRKEVFL